MITGRPLRHTRGHLYRAALEATGYAVRHHLEVFRESGASSRTRGRGRRCTKGGLWTQIVSDATGQSQELPQQTIGASYGDTLFAAIAVRPAEPRAAWNEHHEVVHPADGR